jgi:2-oxoglutarate ferredoxin oxidoreductase subunit alpha
MPVMILADGLIGQMMEGVVLPPLRDASRRPDRPWAVGGRISVDRPANHVSSLIIDPPALEVSIRARFERYERIAKERTSFEAVNTEKAELIFVAYGSAARVCLGAIQEAKKQGLELGLLRPISLWPYPKVELKRLARLGKRFLAVEMSMGQMVEDLRLAVCGTGGGAAAKVDFYGRCGGVIPSEEEILAEARKIIADAASASAAEPRGGSARRQLWK